MVCRWIWPWIFLPGSLPSAGESRKFLLNVERPQATTLRQTYEKPHCDHEVTKFSKDHEEECVFFVAFVGRLRVFVSSWPHFYPRLQAMPMKTITAAGCF